MVDYDLIECGFISEYKGAIASMPTNDYNKPLHIKISKLGQKVYELFKEEIENIEKKDE